MNKMSITSKHIFSGLSMLAFFLGFYLQTCTYANHDSVWLLHCAQSLLAHKKYYFDFFETNPPLILFLYAPVIWIAQLTGLPVYLTLLITVFVSIACMIGICGRLLKKIFIEKPQFVPALTFILTICFCLLPLYWLADRETYTVILVMPYLLLMVLYLQKKSLPMPARIGIGILAAIGFSMKPYFLFPLVLIELYYLVNQKRFFAWVRAETLIMLTLMILYVALTYLITPEYFTYIFPLSSQLYVTTFGITFWRDLFFLIYTPATVLSLMLIGWQIKHAQNESRAFFVIFLLATTGFLFSYLIQARVWFYHAMPMTICGLIALSLSIITTFDLFKQKNQFYRADYIQMLIGFFAFFLFMQPFVNSVQYNYVQFYIKRYADNPEHQVLSFVQNHAQQQNVLVISGWFLQETIRNESSAHIVSRFPSMLLMPGIQKLSLEGNFAQYQKMKSLYIGLIVQDMKKAPPAYIIIEKKGYWFKFNGSIRCYDFLPFYLTDPAFKNIFSHYHLVAGPKDFWVFAKT